MSLAYPSKSFILTGVQIWTMIPTQSTIEV